MYVPFVSELIIEPIVWIRDDSVELMPGWEASRQLTSEDGNAAWEVVHKIWGQHFDHVQGSPGQYVYAPDGLSALWVPPGTTAAITLCRSDTAPSKAVLMVKAATGRGAHRSESPDSTPTDCVPESLAVAVPESESVTKIEQSSLWPSTSADQHTLHNEIKLKHPMALCDARQWSSVQVYLWFLERFSWAASYKATDN
jgi:hypothetical protein